MDDFDDYYAILGTSRGVTGKDIKKAYLDKCFILHPDRLQGAPESARRLAEQELVRVNKAYEVLSDTQKRQAYDIKWVAHKDKPRPVVEPSKIQFKNMRPGETRSASFVIRNTGGPYSNISIPNPDTWVRLIKWHSLSNTDELPLQVSIEAEGPNTGNQFNETIKIKLDNEESNLPVIMQMRKETCNPLGRIFKKKKDGKIKRKKKSQYQIPNWLKALLFIFPFSVIGLGISILVGVYIPFWILLGFSLFYSIDKWLYYPTRKHKSVGKLYRLLLNLSILSLLGLTIWSGIELFSQRFLHNPIVGSLIFLLEIVFFIWFSRVVSKNSWRWPSMKLTMFSLICLFIIFSFSGVQPMAGYKDAAINKIMSLINEQIIKADERSIAEENARAIEKSEMDTLGVVSEYDFYKVYVVLFNEFRSENGRQPLVFDSTLNKLAAKRAVEISQLGNFSHEGIEQYNLGENIAMMAYSSDSANDLIEQWATSPGHRSNMLLSSYYSTGFAKNGKYAVQIFE